MKKQCLAMLTVVLVSASVTMAASVPNGWSTSPNYTYQQWTFSSASSNGVYSPDTSTNAYGTASVSVANYVGWNNGYATISGPQTSSALSPMMSASIPSTANEVWADVVFQCNANFWGRFYLAVFDNQGNLATMATPNLDPIDATNGIYELSTTFTFANQVSGENMIFGLTDMATGEYIGIDTATIATVPEPFTLGLLACGGLALIRRKK